MGSTSEPTVLVTGFGEFLDIKTNPSWEIASSLPQTINGIRIIIEPQPLKAIYHSLLDVPKLLEKHNPDIVIHIGLAVDRNYFAIEKGADRDGYHQFPDEARKVFTRAESKMCLQPPSNHQRNPHHHRTSTPESNLPLSPRRPKIARKAQSRHRDPHRSRSRSKLFRD
ncbi:uncharacterized protein PAC_17843 [Phialocephala subalpina]|uniref:Pyroglutamyl-peptidase I n=1 Tax=Phialocephala subalpina TaxID=576137 RepID=A0A1L7XSC1_9HELO|nr:uncharacterized protein PAC_17843 [Phialocephala subalpina]